MSNRNAASDEAGAALNAATGSDPGSSRRRDWPVALTRTVVPPIAPSTLPEPTASRASECANAPSVLRAAPDTVTRAFPALRPKRPSPVNDENDPPETETCA